LVLHIQTSKTKQIVESSDGTPYVRRGAQSLPVNSHDELKRLEYDKGIITYEQQTLNVPNKLISESEVIQKFISDVIPTTEPKPWLKKQLLIQNGKPTVAGVILFADEPQVALPKQSGIKIFRYKTKDPEGSRATLAFDPITIEVCAYRQIKDAVDKTTEIVEDMQYLGEKGFESIQYPFETLHEIITNAVIHRDYSIKSDILIVIFDNRIEIKSPGKLPGHVTIDNILDEQLARNGTIV
jgi:ATP-dependent DNA helicase RecG